MWIVLNNSKVVSYHADSSLNILILLFYRTSHRRYPLQFLVILTLGDNQVARIVALMTRVRKIRITLHGYDRNFIRYSSRMRQRHFRCFYQRITFSKFSSFVLQNTSEALFFMEPFLFDDLTTICSNSGCKDGRYRGGYGRIDVSRGSRTHSSS